MKTTVSFSSTSVSSWPLQMHRKDIKPAEASIWLPESCWQNEGGRPEFPVYVIHEDENAWPPAQGNSSSVLQSVDARPVRRKNSVLLIIVTYTELPFTKSSGRSVRMLSRAQIITSDTVNCSHSQRKVCST